jgi:hypothetical protein
MDVDAWWVVMVAASLGLFAGIVLFAVLTMAADRDDDAHPHAQDPTQTVI